MLSSKAVNPRAHTHVQNKIKKETGDRKAKETNWSKQGHMQIVVLYRVTASYVTKTQRKSMCYTSLLFLFLKLIFLEHLLAPLSTHWDSARVLSLSVLTAANSLDFSPRKKKKKKPRS